MKAFKFIVIIGLSIWGLTEFGIVGFAAILFILFVLDRILGAILISD